MGAARLAQRVQSFSGQLSWPAASSPSRVITRVRVGDHNKCGQKISLKEPLCQLRSKCCQ
jgi:hypothetical protein